MKPLKMCDNCGNINPKPLYDSERLCGECAVPKGFYKRPGWKLGANGKIHDCKFQFPFIFKFKWRGWFGWK